MTINFCADEVSNANPEVMSALATFCSDNGYASDVECNERLTSIFSDLFEIDVEIFPIITEAAANAQALSSVANSSSKIYCHSESRVYVDHAETVQLFTKGAELVPLEGDFGKITPSMLDKAFGLSSLHKGASSANIVTISQATEFGTVYESSEILRISELSHDYGTYVHMDGSHFSNAVASLSCCPADITWKVGVDILTFGTTRNGTIAGEAVIFFNNALSEGFQERCDYNGHSFEKKWFPSIQLETHVLERLWLNNASRANQVAKILATRLEVFRDIRLCYSVQTNKVFAEMPVKLVQGLLSDGFRFSYSEEGNSAIVQLVANFNTDISHIDALLESVERHLDKSDSP